jgi:hypothetical protein
MDEATKVTGQHTPGPWRQGITLVTPQTRHWSKEQIGENDAHERLRVFAFFRDHDQGRSRELVAECRSEADARLIAAAPALLEALEHRVRTCICHVGQTKFGKPECKWCDSDRAAIRAARGEQS